MPFVVKSHPQAIHASRTPSTSFTEWAYENALPKAGDDIAWFTAETSGGFGLYAVGRVTTDAQKAGKNAKGNALVAFQAEFYSFEPLEPLQKADFASLPRIGTGSPIQELNRRLYLNSHVKVAEISIETFQFLAARF